MDGRVFPEVERESFLFFWDEERRDIPYAKYNTGRNMAGPKKGQDGVLIGRSSRTLWIAIRVGQLGAERKRLAEAAHQVAHGCARPDSGQEIVVFTRQHVCPLTLAQFVCKPTISSKIRCQGAAVKIATVGDGRTQSRLQANR